MPRAEIDAKVHEAGPRSISGSPPNPPRFPPAGLPLLHVRRAGRGPGWHDRASTFAGWPSRSTPVTFN